MIRTRSLLALAVLAVPLVLFPPTACAAQSASADAATRTLVLPLRPIGVSDTTAYVSRELLVESLRDLGVSIVPPDPGQDPPPRGEDACDEPGCAVALGRQHGAARVIYGSLSSLGGKVIARMNVIRVEETVPYYRDQLTATYEEDLDQVMRRFAEGIAAGRPNSDQASVNSVTQAETMAPARRAARSGVGVRAGFLFPTEDSFGGTDRLTNLRLIYRYELATFQIESSTILGFTWGDGVFDWTILDLSACRIFGTKDLSAYLGAGLGVHTISIQDYFMVDGGYGFMYETGFEQTETVPTVDLIVGLMALRTYDFQAVLEVRYRYVFENFERVGGKGAQGVMVTFGTGR